MSEIIVKQVNLNQDKIDALEFQINGLKEQNKYVQNEYLKILKKLDSKNKIFEDQNKLLKQINKTNTELIIYIQKLEETIEELKIKTRKLNSSKGGYTAKINTIKKELKKANKIIIDLKSDRYLVRNVRSAKPNNTQRMKVRLTPYNSQTNKILKEKTLCEEAL